MFGRALARAFPRIHHELTEYSGEFIEFALDSHVAASRFKTELCRRIDAFREFVFARAALKMAAPSLSSLLFVVMMIGTGTKKQQEQLDLEEF